eukprot:145589_1
MGNCHTTASVKELAEQPPDDSQKEVYRETDVEGTDLDKHYGSEHDLEEGEADFIETTIFFRRNSQVLTTEVAEGLASGAAEAEKDCAETKTLHTNKRRRSDSVTHHRRPKRRSVGEIQVSSQQNIPHHGNAPLKKALIVEDVELTTKIIVKSLQRCGYSCEVARDGKEAVQKALGESFYVILMDVWMPELNGLEATKRIRDYEKHQLENDDLAFIFGTTGSCEREDLHSYAAAGMDGCIEKGSVLSQALHEAIAMKEASPNEFVFINHENIHIDEHAESIAKALKQSAHHIPERKVPKAELQGEKPSLAGDIDLVPSSPKLSEVECPLHQRIIFFL